jgi:hypothetical protein
MQYDTEAWQKERNGWLNVVQLNLVRSILAVLSAVESEISGEYSSKQEGEEPTFTDMHQVCDQHVHSPGDLLLAASSDSSFASQSFGGATKATARCQR